MIIEVYKGIEFVRISAMPGGQQALIHTTFDKSRIIKILRENELLSDCILAADYHVWAAGNKKVAAETPVVKATVSELKLAFK